MLTMLSRVQRMHVTNAMMVLRTYVQQFTMKRATARTARQMSRGF